MSDLIYPDESYRINGACFNVYNSMGCGFLEPVYQECLAIEFEHLGIPFLKEPEVFLHYRNRKLMQKYRPDFICFDKIIVELKAVSKIASDNRAQVMNYLSATGFELAILYNFGHYPKLEFERFANTKNK